ncbi:PREDICTED: heavy metal-associated isoprenylated plant protein 8-like [Nicotiana attenuata]|uniref:Heavy metal-associated isoprenylated plant protein 3 n=1 Tax=Nicotiana attenuata TaxID=49451 RepID=A0A1J6HS54_NICAT|nr:PREDICTED: heavy metal-associated isoprenylated plant protein 8-like [Nicotiana attenuata]OIS95764.1 heavy metal-associated isoprenylated plant protein 3 [Nicotiana attenuata]
MGKGKQQTDQQENNKECNNGNKMEEKKSTNEENKNNAKGVIIILGVYIHCQGCKEEVLKSLRGFDGVEEIEVDEKNHKVVVKGKKADPLKVAERLRKKSGKHVELISPIIPPKKKEEKKEIKQQPKVVEVILKLYLHCEGCAKDAKQCIHKMPGVQTVDPEMKNNLVKVKGSMDPQKLVEFISKRAGKHAEIVKSSKIDKEQKNEKPESDKNKATDIKKDGCSCKHEYPYPPQLVYAPQLFSDENPNSCSIL